VPPRGADTEDATVRDPPAAAPPTGQDVRATLARICRSIHVCVCTHVLICVCVYMYIQIYICIYVCMYVCIIYMCVCKCIYTEAPPSPRARAAPPLSPLRIQFLDFCSSDASRGTEAKPLYRSEGKRRRAPNRAKLRYSYRASTWVKFIYRDRDTRK